MEQESQVNPSQSIDEDVLIVDENNVSIGSAKRKQVRAENLWHRASYIFIQNKQGKLLVQKRTLTKDYCPGYYDLVSGGVFSVGETDELNAQRELEEELGISGIELKVLALKKFESSNNKVWGNIFAILDYDGPIKLQKEEIEQIYEWSIEEIKEKIDKGEQITPDSIQAFYEALKLGIIKSN